MLSRSLAHSSWDTCIHVAVLPVFIKTWTFLISLIIFISFKASFVMQFHYNVRYLTPLSTDNWFQISVICANILSGTMFLSISSRYTEWSALYKFLSSAQTDTTLVPPTDDSKSSNLNQFSEQCHKIAIVLFVPFHFASVHVSVHYVHTHTHAHTHTHTQTKKTKNSSLESLTNVFHVLA